MLMALTKNYIQLTLAQPVCANNTVSAVTEQKARLLCGCVISHFPDPADCVGACLPASHHSSHHPDPEEHRTPGGYLPLALHPGCLPLHDDHLPCCHRPPVQQIHSFTRRLPQVCLLTCSAHLSLQHSGCCWDSSTTIGRLFDKSIFLLKRLPKSCVLLELCSH